MKYVKLGRTGLDVSRICLGCMSYGDASRSGHQWVLDEEASLPFIRKALEEGINFFDTANVYSLGSSEEFLGRAIRDHANRDEVVIATKPGVTAPISGATKENHIDDAVAAVDLELTAEEITQLEEPYVPHPVAGFQ